MAIYTDGKLKASLSTEESLNAKISVGSGGGISKKQLDEALSTKADINHTHEEYLTEHQSIEHLASIEYVNDSLKEKSDELISYTNNSASNAVYDAVNEIKNNELPYYATTTILKDYGTTTTTLTQDEFSSFIGELRTEIDELKSFVSSTVISAEPISNYYTEYKINNTSTYSLRNRNVDTVGSGGYLPECSNGKEFIKITLLDGNLTTDLNTRVSKVDSIRVYYSEGTTEISFANTKIQDVTYINLENIENVSFTNCEYIESIDLTHSNSNGYCVTESTFEGVSDECIIVVGKDWETDENQAGFNGTYVRPFSYYIDYTLLGTENNFLNDNSFPTITNDEYTDIDDYNQDFNLVEVYLKDGSVITELFNQIPTLDVDHIIVYYPQDTAKLHVPSQAIIVNELITDNFKSFDSMFSACHYLTEIKGIEEWTTDNVTNTGAMFASCRSLTSLNLSNWDFENVTYAYMMFSGCTSLQTLNLSYWKFNVDEGADPFGAMFENIPSDIDWCYDPENPDSYANWTLTEEETGFSGTFPWNKQEEDEENPYYTEYTVTRHSSYTLESRPKSYIPEITVDGENYTRDFKEIQIVLNDDSITYDRTTPIDDIKLIRAYYDESVIGMKFGNSSPYVTAVNYIKTDNFTSLKFGGVATLKLNYINTSCLNTSKIINMSSMFQYCKSLTSLDLSNFNTSNVTDMDYMFQGCSSLQTLDLSNWDTKNVRGGQGMVMMFSDCKSLTSLDLSHFDVSEAHTADMFSNCESLTSLNVSGWTISSPIGRMFKNCSSLTSLDLSSWNIVSGFLSMSDTFSGCTSLTSLNLSNWNTTNFISKENAFAGVPENIDWCYDPENPDSYANWTLTEEETGFSGTFPWNQRNEEKIKIHIIDPVNAYNSASISNSGGSNISFDISVNKTIEIDASLLELDKYPFINVSGENSSNGTNIDNITGSEMWYDTISNNLKQYDYSYETSLLKINYIHHLMAVDPINICVINGLSRDYSCNLDYGTTECQLELEVVNSYCIYIEINGVPYDSFDITAANEIWLLSGDKHIYTERPEIPNYEQFNLRIHLFRENEENYDSYNASIAFGDGNWDSSFEMNNDEYGGYLEYSLYTNINYRITVSANNYSENDNPHVILLEEPISDIWLIWGDDNIYYENPLEDDSASSSPIELPDGFECPNCGKRFYAPDGDMNHAYEAVINHMKICQNEYE